MQDSDVALRQFRSYVESAGDVVFTLTTSGCFRYVSPQCHESLGYEPSELINSSFMALVHPDDLLVWQNYFTLVLESGKKQHGAEFRLLHKNGTWFWYSVSGSRLRGREFDAVFIGFGRDITDLKRIQSEQIKAEKLESLNLLAAGIAHNFNNILTGVIGYIAFARKHLKNHDKTAPMLEAAEKSSYRAARLARQLLTFSKGGVPFRRLTAVDTLVRESMTMFLGGSNIKGIIDDHATLMINVDCEQIKQVINNIIINAMHSMPNGGELAVNLTDLQVDAGNVFLLKPGKYVKIDFEDNGCGIKKEHLDKVFDPYFTTHADGSGLGLSLAHSIIAKHDGEISVSSEADRGTTVTIMLPGFQTVPEENTLEKEEMLRNAVGVTLQLHGK